MKCPICGQKLIITYPDYQPDFPTFECAVEVYLGKESESHYSKWLTFKNNTDYYVEYAIAMPYQIVNHYINDEYQKPHCLIRKLTEIQTPFGIRQRFEPILKLNMIVEVLKYKKMQNRIKTILLMS